MNRVIESDNPQKMATPSAWLWCDDGVGIVEANGAAVIDDSFAASSLVADLLTVKAAASRRTPYTYFWP
jgi:hypothetical protein